MNKLTQSLAGNAIARAGGGAGAAGMVSYGGGGTVNVALDDMSVKKALKEYFEKQNGFAALNVMQAPTEDYLKDFPLILDSFLAVDFRMVLNKSNDNETQRGYVTSANHFFTKLSMMTNENPQVLAPYGEKLGKLLKWWGIQLKNSEVPLDGIAKATQSVLSAIQMSLMKDNTLGEPVLPGALSCLTVKDDSLVQVASGVVGMIARGNKKAMTENVNEVLRALEVGVPGNSAISLLTSLDGIYSRAREPIHAHIDTIAEYTVTHTMAAVGGCMLLQKVAKRCPRLLYAFVDDFVPLLSNQSVGMFVLQMFADIAARNALIFVPHLQEITMAAEDIGLQYGSGVTTMGYVGRTQREKAKEVVENFVTWITDDVDPQATPLLIEQVRNVGGVYKNVLDPHMEELRKLASHSDSKVKDEAEKLVQYYDGEEKYLSEAFLTNQEDMYGRMIEAVNQAVEAKTADMGKNVEEILKRVDHQEERTKDLEEKHYVLSEAVDSADERINVVELAAKEHEERLNEVESSIEDIQKELKEKDEEIKSFIAEVSKKLPVPVGVEAKGKIRKRILLRFQCAKGRKPDFIMETASWTKWLRVAASAVSVGKSVAVGDVGGTIQGLADTFSALRRKDADPNLKFETLTKQPFLTSAEQDELINGLRDQGFFDEFEYNANTAQWERKQLEPGTFSVETGAAYKPAEQEKPEAKQVEERSGENKSKANTTSSNGSTDGSKSGKDNQSANKADESAPGKMPNLEEDLPKKGENVILNGFMDKKGAVRKNIKRRYFELDKKSITYYEDESKGKEKGKIMLRDMVTFVEHADGWLELQTPGVHGGQYFLLIPDKELKTALGNELEKHGFRMSAGANGQPTNVGVAGIGNIPI
eukprot:gb/GECG01006351.1/.p1 GENE.gb/GECG01006351.1/~~gb/GECG01006351.1/.p1  ORF type:complete len:873 (+),score=157.15 gb/GECG01006351.1/:1-2619(+)